MGTRFGIFVEVAMEELPLYLWFKLIRKILSTGLLWRDKLRMT